MGQIINDINTIEYKGLQMSKLTTPNNIEIFHICLEKDTVFKKHISPKDSRLIILEGSITFHINNEDTDLNPMMVTTANTNKYGGEIMRSALGINFLVTNSKFLFCVESGLPIYQNYNDVFVDENFNLNTAIKYTIH